MADLINTLDARHSNIITNDFSYIPDGGSAKIGRVRMLPVLLNVTENGEYEVNAQQEGGFDGMAKVQVNVDVAGGGGGVDPDPTHWNVGDIVIWDEAGAKMVKDVKDAYTNEKYPADNFTPIGIVFFVEEDGSARMISLANMSCTTPDSGTEQLEGIAWGGYGTDLDDLDNYSAVGTINAEGVVSGGAGSAYVPVYSNLFVNSDSLDGVRSYTSTPHMPSPYNEDGTINEEYLKVSAVGAGPFYKWSRQRSGSTYYIYTDKPSDQIDENTKLYGYSQGHDSFVVDYGFPSSGTVNAYLGLITDTTIYTGGVAQFTTDFTDTGETNGGALLANSDLDGAGNTEIILGHQADNYEYDIEYQSNTLYYWQRLNESDGKMYKLFTDSAPDSITDSTKIYIKGQSSSSFVFDYGSSMSYGGSSVYEIGTVGDGTKIEGGAAGFLEHFEHLNPTPWRTAESLLNDGNSSTNFPAACATWRFHTPGTEQGDWYLPAEGENGIFSANNGYICEALLKLSQLRPDIKVGGIGTSYFWSSTEYSSNNAWFCNYYNGNCNSSSYKDNFNYYVRAASLLPAL